MIKDFKKNIRRDIYWGIATHINDYDLPDAMVKDSEPTAALKVIRTRLELFSKKEQAQLINLGYALCGAAMRKHV